MKDKKFSSAEYISQHRAVRAQRGRASDLRCVDCGSKAKDWSLRDGRDPEDIYSYDPRCRKCHMAYDGHAINGGNAKGAGGRRTGIPQSESNKTAVSAANKGHERWLGKKHREESRDKMSGSQKKAAKGRKRDEYGRFVK